MQGGPGRVILGIEAARIEFLVPVLRAMAKTALYWTDDLPQRYLIESRAKRNLQGGLGFCYPSPWPRWAGEEWCINLVVRQSEGSQLSNGRMVDFLLLWRERDNWFKVGGNAKHLDHTNPADMTWFLEKAKVVWPFFEPDFACGDKDVSVGKNFGEDPYSVAWPLAYYGPDHVAKLGKEKLLKAPVWNVTEDERGGVWVQAAENPSNVDRKELRALADHLGLQRPK